MIDLISPDDLRTLAEAHDRHCVSIYLPTHPGGNETAQDPIRFKNLLGRAREELETLGLSRRAIDDLLAEADALRADAHLWGTGGHGLAVFVTTAATSTYRLPLPVDELVVVADRFHLKPLLSSVTTADEFYVLALSQNEVRLLRGNRFAVDDVPLGDIPASMADALAGDDREAQLQSHAAGREGDGSTVAAFHGQGGGKDSRKDDLDRFLTLVDHGLTHVVGTTGAPLALAGTEQTVAHFRKVSSYAHIAEGEIRGNPERTSRADLHRRAWPLVEPLLDVVRRRVLEAIASASVPTHSALPQIVRSAIDGRVESLVVPRGVQRWGTFSAESRVAIEHESRQPGDRDLLDVAAIETLTHGGNVYVVPRSDLPAHLPVAATLRY